jgi:hypothetical protein
MHKLLALPAIAGLAVSLLGTGVSLVGTTQSRDVRASGLGHRLSSIEMKRTQGGQGARYACTEYVCYPPPGAVSCSTSDSTSTEYIWYGGQKCHYTNLSGDYCTNNLLNQSCTQTKAHNAISCGGDVTSTNTQTTSKCAN